MQTFFSGILSPVTGIVKIFSNFMLYRWVVEAFGTINDLNSLVSSIQMIIPGYVREAENFYTFTFKHLTFDWMIIGLMAVFLYFGSFCILKYQLEKGK